MNFAELSQAIREDDPLIELCAKLAAIAIEFPDSSGSIERQGIEFMPDESQDNDLWTAEIDAAKNELCSVVSGMEQWLMHNLQNEHDYKYEDANLLETAEGNDYQFDEDGRIV